MVEHSAETENLKLFELLSIDWQREDNRYSYSGRHVSNCSSWRVTSAVSSSSPLSGHVSASVSIRLPSMCSSSVIVSAPLDRFMSNSCSVGAIEHSRKNFASSPWAVVSANANGSSFIIGSFSDGSRRIDHRDERRSSPPAPSEQGGDAPPVVVFVGGIATVAPVSAVAPPIPSAALLFGDWDNRKCMGPAAVAPLFDSYDPLLLLLLLLRLFALLEQFSSTFVGECSDTRSSPQ
uniref:Uncharacterized protein n=1 Tax=Anopheles farauti TaxID=69004 RepID=A0A182QGY1_9DIPT